MQNRKIELRSLVVCALMLTLMLLMTYTPIGFIGIGPISITMVHLPVLVGLLCEGFWAGLFLGGAFGVISLLRSFTPTTLLSPLFMNPLISIVPRLLIPICAWGAFRLALRLLPKASKRRDYLVYAISAAVGSLANTVFVLSAMYLFAGLDVAARMQVSPELVGGIMLTSVLTNGLPEAAFSVLAVPPLTLAVRRAMRRGPLQ